MSRGLLELTENLSRCHATAVCLIEVGVEADEAGVLAFCDNVLVGIIKIKPEAIHCSHYISHRGSGEADERYSTIE